MRGKCPPNPSPPSTGARGFKTGTDEGTLMPTYKYEAMDTSGGEVKDSVDAMNEEEAQQKIKQMGYFVTKITEQAGGKKKGKKGAGAGKRDFECLGHVAPWVSSSGPSSDLRL